MKNSPYLDQPFVPLAVACGPRWQKPRRKFSPHHQPRSRGSRRGPRCCVNGLRRSQLCRSQSRLHIGPGCRTCPGARLISRCDQYPILAERIGGSDCKPLSGACARSRSRRSSSMRARILAKSSAARGRFTAFPPFRSVSFDDRSIACELAARPSVVGLIIGGKPRHGLGLA